MRDNFATNRNVPPSKSQGYLDQAFTGLRELLHQKYLALCSSTAITDGVKLDATAKFMDMTLRQGMQEYFFIYRIRITNLREDTIQVLGREWHIHDSHGRLVNQVPYEPGNGVVGQTPKIPAGKCFEYYSGTTLPTPSGFMKGLLRVKSTYQTDLEMFADIHPFRLIKPQM